MLPCKRDVTEHGNTLGKLSSALHFQELFSQWPLLLAAHSPWPLMSGSDVQHPYHQLPWAMETCCYVQEKQPALLFGSFAEVCNLELIFTLSPNAAYFTHIWVEDKSPFSNRSKQSYNQAAPGSTFNSSVISNNQPFSLCSRKSNRTQLLYSEYIFIYKTKGKHTLST